MARKDGASFTVDLHFARALEDEIKLLARLVVVALGRTPRGEMRFGEALVAHRRIRSIQNAANRRAVPGGKWSLLPDVLHRHKPASFIAPLLMKFFHGCTALITGASAGLGVEMARQLAPAAHTLILVARRVERLVALQEELQRAHPALDVFIYGLDLADETRLGEFLAWLEDNGLHVNFLINNAGLGDHGPFATSEWEKVKTIIAVNIIALTRLTHALLPTLRASGRAAILNVSSVASFLPVPDLAVYAATKAYVTSFSEAIRAELRGTSVSITALCPGPVETEFGDVARRGEEPGMPSPEFFKVSAEQVVRDSLRAVAADRARVVPGWLVAALMGILSVLPMVLLRLALNARARSATH